MLYPKIVRDRKLRQWGFMQNQNVVEIGTMVEDLADSATQTLISIGLKIREMRQIKGLTLQALADATKISPSMLSLVERGRASPSIGTLIVVANALSITMSDLLQGEAETDDNPVVRASEAKIIETAEHVIRSQLRSDRDHAITIAVNEYAPHTGSNEKPISHDGFEYGYVLDGNLTVEVDGQKHHLAKGDLVGYKSTRPHRIWNHGELPARTLWLNLRRD